MAEKLGFYELLEPYFSLGLAAQNADGATLRDLRDASAPLAQSLPGASATLARIVTGILDYLSVEELHTAADELAVVYRGSAKFGGEGRANPDLPTGQSITSTSGQELSWQDDMLAFRLTVPRRSSGLAINTSGLSGADLADIQQLNALLASFDDASADAISDAPGNDFRLEMLIRTVKIVLPKDDFIPARVGADGWLEPDPNFKEVVFEFPRLAFVLEQQGAAGNPRLTLKSWDAAGFDDPGDVDTARFFTLTPPLFLHSSRRVGFGIERLVADFSDDITPPEILEQFGIGDDFNGFWLPMIRIFIAPGRTTGLAFSARGKDLLFDLDKGFSGELALDILNRGGKLEVEPVFYTKNAKTPIEWTRGQITRNDDGTTVVEEGTVIIAGAGELHLSIRGSIAPYRVTVLHRGAPLAADTSAGVNQPKWLIPASGIGVLTIDVSDKDGHNSWHETIEAQRIPASEPAQASSSDKHYDQLFLIGAGDDGYQIVRDETLSVEKNLVVRLTPELPPPVLRIGTQVIPRKPNGSYAMVLTPGDVAAQLIATWQSPASGKIEQPLFFKLNYPKIPDQSTATIAENFIAGEPNEFLGLDSTNLGADNATIRARLQEFLDQTSGPITIDGFASFERASLASFDNDLANRRALALGAILKAMDNGRTITPPIGHGHADDQADTTNIESDPNYRFARASAAPLVQSKFRHATAELVERPATTVTDPPVEHPPEASEPERPPIFRRLGFRVRFERGKLVLGEISGELDFRLQSEEAAGFIQSGDTRNSGSSQIASAVTTPPTASKSGEQGVLDYRLTISYDSATRRLTEVLALGFDQQARDGWVNIERFEPLQLADTLGSLLVFAPLLNAGIDSAVNASGDEAVKNAIIAGAEVAIATTLGFTGMLRMRKVTLFGIELSATELLPDNQAEEHTRFGDLSAMFDYAVDFDVDINLGLLTIRSKRDFSTGKAFPTRVRYRGFGFRLNFQDAHAYAAVFDTSKGFDLGMAEPGALIVGGPLGPLLRVDSLRVARQNPLMLEMDLGLNANLGVVKVDTVRVRIPIDPPGMPTIIPTGISVNIPGTIVGSGFLDIRDSGFTGAIDVTLVPFKLRVQASVGLQHLEDGDRQITAFFLGLGVEFPAPIPLANSGLGIYGLLGLFGMHYKRDEDAPVNPNLPVALDWFYNKAKGEPHLIAVDGRPTWIAAPDRWSFGVGLVLGTMEGAFILNLKGMLVLELPGPRILIFVKAQIFQPRPPSGKPADQSAGILAVVDLNFQVGYIAVGLIFTYEIKDLLRIEVPIDTQFSFHDIEDWHLYIGSLRNKASADILGIAKGTAYLMFDGQGIPDFPLGALNGFSIAAGIAASLVLGDESSGLYAKIAGAVDVGVSTAPLHFYGRMKLEGRIHLWFIGLGASAQLDVEAPEPLFVKGTVCGSVDLWFTEIEGCVGITIGEPQPLPEPEPLMTGLSLQSHSPALTEGQATDQPIDTSLGVSHNAGETVLDMPLDTIPVLQMKYPPVFATAATGLQPLSSAPTLPPGSDGWFALGGLPGQEGERELRYEIQSLTISPALLDGVTDMPVTWWQPARPNAPADSQATDKGVNLALNSWIPLPFPRAYQRSEEQRRTIRDRFEVICRQIAPATRVLWTLNAHFTMLTNTTIRNPADPFPGPSSSGWRLNGAAWPDPPAAQRTRAPETRLHVHEADYPYRNNHLVLEYAAKLTGQLLAPARVVPAAGGIDSGQALQLPFLQFAPGMQDDNLANELREVAKMFLDQAGDRERIVVEAGDAAEVRALICANVERKVTEFMLLRGFDDQNKLVEEIKLPGHAITAFNQLPSEWQDATGPWANDVRRVFELLAGSFKGSHQLFLIEWQPRQPIARFELVYRADEQATSLFRNPPPVLLGVVETLMRAEVERVVHEQHYQDDMVGVVVKSLEEGDKRPLFAPDTLYTVTASYTGVIRKSNDHTVHNSKNFSQQFTFRTAAHAPKRLNPWVLATVPENDAGGHFTDDKLQFIFNDAAAIQLFKAFGRTLRAVLRKASGNHPPDQPTIDTPVLQPIKALLRTPYAHSMHALVAEMPCVPQISETEQHQVFTVDIPLERGTSYMLDIESTPAADDALTPLFRTAFSTSRFASAGELAALVATSFIRERVMKNALTLPIKTQTLVIPDDTTPTHTASADVQIVTDAEIEAALLAALGSDVPPAQQPSLTLLWSGAAPAQLKAVLIDAPESLLRTRPVPVEVATPAPDDDIIQHFQTGRQLWLEVIESGAVVVDRIVYATGGCRALIFLKDAAAGSLQLALRQYRHTLLTSEPLAQDFALVNMPLPTTAPWEV